MTANSRSFLAPEGWHGIWKGDDGCPWQWSVQPVFTGKLFPHFAHNSCQHQAIENGGISIQQLQDIASQLDPRVGGELRRLIQGPSFELGRTAGRTLLCSWYKFSLFEGCSSKEATSLLVKVLRHPDINLLPLAAEIERSSSLCHTKVVLKSPLQLTSSYCAAYHLEQVNYQILFISTVNCSIHRPTWRFPIHPIPSCPLIAYGVISVGNPQLSAACFLVQVKPQ